MALEFNFMQTGVEDWTETNWHRVAVMLNGASAILKGDGSEFAVIQNTPAAQNVIVGTGQGWINGVHVRNPSPLTITVGAADGTYDRYDYVVLEANWSTHAVTAKVIAGTAAASPVPPTLTQTDGVLWQFPLALLLVPHGTSSIVTADITDERVYLFGTDFNVLFDGGGAVNATGLRGYCCVPFDCTIEEWIAIGNPSGSATFDIKKATYANFPTTTSICGSAKPAISSAQKARSTTLTGWTTAIDAGDILEFYLDSCTSMRLILLVLLVRLRR